MSKIHFNNTFSSGCVQFMAADWPATTAHKMIYLLTSYTVGGRRETTPLYHICYIQFISS